MLLQSATSKKDFSAYRAAAGFNAIQVYAGNLIAQPWRKEYRQIKVGASIPKSDLKIYIVYFFEDLLWFF